MMQQSLRITRHDIKFEMRTQQAELKYNMDKARSSMKSSPASINVTQNTPTGLNLDTYAARKVVGFSNVSDVISESATSGQQNALNYMAQTARDGRTLGDSSSGVGIKDVIQQRKASDYNLVNSTFTPALGPDISWTPNVFETSYQEGSLKTDWTVSGSSFEYIPGGVSMEIIQLPSVEIEYVGKPMYFPRSYAERFE